MTIQEIKDKIKELKKLKKDAPVKTKFRRDVNKKIRTLKEELERSYNLSPEKADLINKIYQAEPHLKKLKIDLRKFTTEELKYHYETKILKIQKRG